MKKWLVGLMVVGFSVGVAIAKPSSSGGSSSSSNKSSGSSKSSSSSNKPSSSGSSYKSSGSSAKPSASTSYDSGASKAQKQEQSRVKFEKSNPKSEYTVAGRTAKVDSNSHSVKTIRTMSSNDYHNRTVRVENHYHQYYGPRYDYYRSRPSIYIGGGYSCLFWYAMLDWSMDRRAMWLYHHQNEVDQQLYAQQIQNAELRGKISALEAQGVSRSATYVDPEFKGNPDLMYSDEYVKAAYNPQQTPVNNDSGAIVEFLKWLGIIVVCLLALLFIVWLVFFRNRV